MRAVFAIFILTVFVAAMLTSIGLFLYQMGFFK
jgi:hypothetical protein